VPQLGDRQSPMSLSGCRIHGDDTRDGSLSRSVLRWP
jgi:hypothetical protein